MRRYVLLLLVIASLKQPSVHALPGDSAELTDLEVLKIGGILPQFGYEAMECTEGAKTEELKRYVIVADCHKGKDRYFS